MRSLIWFAPVFAACAASHSPEAPAADSVRARLTEPTKLLMTADSTGSLTASRYTHDGWQDGTIAIAIDNGELDAKVDASGNLAVDNFSVNVAPIDIPESVFGKAAQLKDVRVTLGEPPAVTTTWTDANDAVATASIALDLSWTLVVDGNAAPLGTQHLAALPIDITLSGSGDEVDASIGVHGTGELWKWADLLKLEQLDLELVATTAF